MSMLESAPFVQFDPNTGAIVACGFMQNAAIVHLRLLGKPYLAGDGRPNTHQVDLTTMQIVETPAEQSQMSLDLE